jgi:perosamine synthetase
MPRPDFPVVSHNRPTLGADEQDAVCRVLAAGWVAQGREVAAFEDELCAFLGIPARHAVALSSGSAALYLALKVLDAKGKRVACPVYACSALTNAIALSGAVSELIDSSADSPNIDIDALSRSQAEFAIVPHMFGIPVEVDKIKECQIIEDVAQALGARVGNKPAGISGDIGVFSFYATKLITTGGQGGMLVSLNRDFIETARDFREFDCRDDRKPRFNLQMTDLQAAIGRVQLTKLPTFIARREELFQTYKDVGLPVVEAQSDGAVRYRCVVRSPIPQKVIEKLSDEGIKAIVPVEDWELLGDAAEFPNAAEFAHSTISLPIYPLLSNQDQDRVISAVLAD